MSHSGRMRKPKRGRTKGRLSAHLRYSYTRGQMAQADPLTDLAGGMSSRPNWVASCRSRLTCHVMPPVVEQSFTREATTSGAACFKLPLLARRAEDYPRPIGLAAPRS